MSARRKSASRGGAPLRVDPKGVEIATERVSFVLTTAQLNKLRADAHRAGVSMSELVRRKAMK
jgi:hypothetical protein